LASTCASRSELHRVAPSPGPPRQSIVSPAPGAVATAGYQTSVGSVRVGKPGWFACGAVGRLWSTKVVVGTPMGENRAGPTPLVAGVGESLHDASSAAPASATTVKAARGDPRWLSMRIA